MTKKHRTVTVHRTTEAADGSIILRIFDPDSDADGMSRDPDRVVEQQVWADDTEASLA